MDPYVWGSPDGTLVTTDTRDRQQAATTVTSGSYGPFLEDDGETVQHSGRWSEVVNHDSQIHGTNGLVGETRTHDDTEITSQDGQTKGHEQIDSYDMELDPETLEPVVTIPPPTDRDIFQDETPPPPPADPPSTHGAGAGMGAQDETGTTSLQQYPQRILRPAAELDFELSAGTLPVATSPAFSLEEIYQKWQHGGKLSGFEQAVAADLAGGKPGMDLLRKDPMSAFFLARFLPTGTVIGGGSPGAGALASGHEGSIDDLQTGLGLVGMMPGAGAGPNGVNAAIYLARGQYQNAGLSILAMIPFEKLLGAGAKAFGAIGNEVKAAEPVAAEVNALVPSGSKRLGDWGEARLKALLNDAGEAKKSFSTSLGRREIDRLADGIAHESKAGINVRLSGRIVNQALKDQELIQKNVIDGAHWHFWQGVQQDLLDFLDLLGIQHTVHSEPL